MTSTCRFAVLAALALAPLPALGRGLEGLAGGDFLLRPDTRLAHGYSFDGYKNYWARDAWAWTSARGLFVQSQQTPEAALWAMEEEIGNQFMLEELWVQPGFMQKLQDRDFTVLERPAEAEFNAETAPHLLVSVTDRDAVGRALIAKLPEAWQFRRNRAFYLEDGDGAVFVLACHTPEELERLKSIVLETLEVVKQYDFHRGLAGVTSNYLHITPGVGHDPFELIQIARSLGCDWLSVNGYNDWMLAGPVNRALAEVGDPFLFISGQNVTDGAMYGIDRYPDVQDNTVAQCLDWAKEKGGQYFANLSAAEGEHAARFQGYLVNSPEDVEKTNALNAPFMTRAGDIERPAPATMLAFLEKGAELTQDSLFEAIAKRNAVAVYPEGVIAGPANLVTAMRFLLLDGILLDGRIHGPLSVNATFDSRYLNVDLTSRAGEALKAEFTCTLGPGINFSEGGNVLRINARMDAEHGVANTGRAESVRWNVAESDVVSSAPVRRYIAFNATAAGHFALASISGTVTRAASDGDPVPFRALASIQLPPILGFHTLRYDAPGTVTYPVSVWNSGEASTVELVFVVKKRDTGAEVARIERAVPAAPWTETREVISFDAVAGDYLVEVSALGVTKSGQLAVREAPGEVAVREEDLDGDGVPEVILENDRVRVAVLMEGGRVIEYILKETGENVFFKLWPNTPPLHGTIGGTRPFYPYGGLEEFIGYPYIGGHIVYHHEILQSTGNKGRVRVWANIHGSKISKDYTLYAGGPVLEATYAFSDMTPTIQTFGINPLFELGPSTGPEDHYYFPEDVLVETRPELGRYFGRACFPKEGWAAGHDPEAKVSLVIGYPVNDALYLHLWNNHPDNTPTPYYYTELQPWLQFDHGTTTYFSYYVLGGTEDWKALAETFRAAGLVTERINPAPWDY